MICVKDLLELDSFQNFNLISGEAGLNRKVSWPNIAQTVSITEWLVGGDVILMTGIGMEITKELLNSIVEQAVDGKAACIIILIHEEHIRQIPKETIAYAISRNFPIFEAPWETKLSNVIMDISSMVYDDRYSQIIKNEFMQKVILGKINLEDEYDCRQLENYGLMEEHAVVIIHFNNLNELEKERGQTISRLCEQLTSFLYSEIQLYYSRCLYIDHKDEMIFILKSKSEEQDALKKCLQRIYWQIIKEFSQINIAIGIGSAVKEPGLLAVSYEQARKALLVKTDIPVVNYDELGIYQLFLEIPNKEIIRKYVDKHLGALIEYDKKYRQELFHTLWMFLQHNGNLASTAEALFVHRNTLIKRMEKIEEVLNCSLKSADVRNTYYNCFVLNKYME